MPFRVILLLMVLPFAIRGIWLRYTGRYTRRELNSPVTPTEIVTTIAFVLIMFLIMGLCASK
jgi:hypothetical protein